MVLALRGVLVRGKGTFLKIDAGVFSAHLALAEVGGRPSAPRHLQLLVQSEPNLLVDFATSALRREVPLI